MLRRNEIEKRLSDAIDRACPDVAANVFPEAQPAPAPVVPLVSRKKPAVRRALRAVALAASVAILLAGGFWFERGMVASVLDLDVNPSVELRLNRRDRVIDAAPMNGDAANLLAGMDLRGVDVDVAVNAVLGAMISQGYLRGDADSVLISVESRDAARSAAVLRLVSEKAQSALDATLGQGAVLAQTVKADATLRQTADACGASVGKTALMRALIAENPALTYDALSRLSVNEMAVMLSSKPVKPDGVTVSGKAADGDFIGEARAIEIALASAMAGDGETTSLHVEMDLESGILVYEVEFVKDEIEYEYKIDARAGEVLEWELEWAHPALAGS